MAVAQRVLSRPGIRSPPHRSADGLRGRSCCRHVGGKKTFSSKRSIVSPSSGLSTRHPRGSAARAVQEVGEETVVPPAAPETPPEPQVELAVDTVQQEIAPDVICIQSRCEDRMRFEIEYGLKRGTTDNSYLLKLGKKAVLFDTPADQFQQTYVEELEKAAKGLLIDDVVVTHVNPKGMNTMQEVLVKLVARKGAGKVGGCKDDPVRVHLSNQAVPVIRNHMETSTAGKAALSGLSFQVVRGSKVLELAPGHQLKLEVVSTPRWPDQMVAHHNCSRLLFSSMLFSSHVQPAAAAMRRQDLAPSAAAQPASPAEVTDQQLAWTGLKDDWRFFFDCMMAPTIAQISRALDKLNIRTGRARKRDLQSYDLMSLWERWFRKLAGRGKALAEGERTVDPRDLEQEARALADGAMLCAAFCPRHGPVVRSSASQLLAQYGSWTAAQVQLSNTSKVAVLYASAYGNTAALAQAISRGITKAEVGVEMINLEDTELQEVKDCLDSCQGFCIGSPTLGGHMPTQVSAALGEILQNAKAKRTPCGVYGSFGWSGEAVDEMESRLRNAGFNFGFDAIKVKFRPTEKVLQLCEESGTDLAQSIRKGLRKSQRAFVKPSQGGTAVEKAMGRVVGSLCVVTVKDGDASSSMLASWVSQASFNPPGITVAVKKDRAAEALMTNGSRFNLNILAEGMEKEYVKAMLKPFKPAEDRFQGLDVEVSEGTGCVVLPKAASYLECEVADRLEAGDHWLVYGIISDGRVLKKGAVSAVHHRNTGKTY